jgi:hypothetical protein
MELSAPPLRRAGNGAHRPHRHDSRKRPAPSSG